MLSLEKLNSSSTSHANSSQNNRLLNARENRKALDKSVQLLANRITFLKNQEVITQSRIKEMRKKALDLYSKKKNVDEMKKNKRNLQEENEAFVSSLRERFNSQRNMFKMSSKQRISNLLSQKRTRSELIRIGSKMSDDYIRERRIKEINLRTVNYSLLKQRELEGSIKLESFKNSRIEEARKNYERAVSKEEKLAERRKNQISKMDGLEGVLLDSINKSLRLQDETVEQLQVLKTLPLSEYEAKFKLKEKIKRRKKVKTLA